MKIFGHGYYKAVQATELRYGKKWKWKPKRLDLIQKTKALLDFITPVDVHQEKKFAKGYTLLLSRKNAQVGSLIKELRKLKKPYLYINWDEFIGEGSIYYDQSQNKYQLRYKKQSFDISKIKSVYFDYSDVLEVFYFKRNKFNNKEKMFLARWGEALNTLEFLTSKAKWFPAKPSQMKYEAQNKFGELIFAKNLGLKIPNMIYTNDHREAQKFLRDQESVMKESGLKFYEGSKSNIQVFQTKKINASDAKLASVQTAPCLFQEFIDKKYDLRVVVIGNQVLNAKIESQDNNKSKIDWRGNEHLARFVPYKLPKDIQKKLIKFQKNLGFNFSTFDLVVDQKNNHYFLEMNRPGQWLFVEALSGVPVSKTIAQQM